MSKINQAWDFVNTVHFDHGQYLWVAVVVILLLTCWRRQQRAVAHTAVRGKHKTNRFAVRVVVCGALLLGAWWSFSGALSEPTHATVSTTPKYEAREFIFALDRSGSMYEWDVDAPLLAAAVDAWERQLFNEMEQWRQEFPLLYPMPPEPLSVRKADVPASRIQRFAAGLYISYHVLQSRPVDSTDRYAFFTFDDRAYWLEPLGRDRELVMEAIPEISRKGGGGTNFDGPRQGVKDKGAVQETIDHFKRIGKAKTRVMIFVSDGDAGIDPKRHQQFVEQMTKQEGQTDGQDVHIFFLLTGPKSNFTGNTANSMKKLVKAVNPDTPEFQDAVLWVGDGEAMERALAKINLLETTPIPATPVVQQQPVRHEFILVGLVFLGLFVVACTVFREHY